MDPVTAGVASGAGGLISGVLGLVGQNQANAAAAASIQQQENFQEQMSNTAYQRSVSDMNAAGLNPALMFGSGGPESTPSGGSYTPQNSLGELGKGIASGASTAVQAAQTQQQVQNQTDQTTASVNKDFTTSALNRASTAQTDQQTSNLKVNQDILKAQAQMQQTNARLMQTELPSLIQKAKANNNWAPVDIFFSHIGNAVGGVSNAAQAAGNLMKLAQ